MNAIEGSVMKMQNMLQVVTGYANVKDGQLYYESVGTGQPLILVHAGVADSRMWDDQFQAFGQHYRTIRYDMRGFGKSTAAKGTYPHRQDLHALMAALGIERAILLGLSLGGEVILDFALDYPKMVEALIPVSAAPSGFELQGLPPKYIPELMAAMQQGKIAEAAELQVRVNFDGQERTPEQTD